MTDILITAVLAAPILAGAGYLLRRYPRQTAILATEGGGSTPAAEGARLHWLTSPRRHSWTKRCG